MSDITDKDPLELDPSELVIGPAAGSPQPAPANPDADASTSPREIDTEAPDQTPPAIRRPQSSSQGADAAPERAQVVSPPSSAQSSSPSSSPSDQASQTVQDAPDTRPTSAVNPAPPSKTGHDKTAGRIATAAPPSEKSVGAAKTDGQKKPWTGRMPGERLKTKPMTPDEIGAFKLAVQGGLRTLGQIATDYGTTARTVNRW